MKQEVIAIAIALGAMSNAASAGTAFLASTGTGPACTQAAPCANMNTAIGVAGGGGEVVCLDKSRYGHADPINASVTISCGDGLWDEALPFVNINTPANSKVVIEGLVGDCLGAACSTLIVFAGQGDLELRRVRIGHSGGTSANGLSFTPNGPASLKISDSHFYDLPASGILVKPGSGGTANVQIHNTHFDRNGTGAAGQAGILIQNQLSNIIGVTIANSSVDNNANGIMAGRTNPAVFSSMSLIRLLQETAATALRR